MPKTDVANSRQNLSYVSSEARLLSISPSKAKISVAAADIDQTKELSEVQTTLEFILNSLANGLEISSKQVVGLLANNHKYLMHIALKGMKGADFSKMYAWYQSLYPHTQVLCKLIEKEQHQNAMTLNLNILKCGLYSPELDLAILCSKIIGKLGKEINESGEELAGFAWDWFVD